MNSNYILSKQHINQQEYNFLKEKDSRLIESLKGTKTEYVPYTNPDGITCWKLETVEFTNTCPIHY